MIRVAHCAVHIISRYRQNSAINAGIGSDMGIVSILCMLINWEKTKNIHFVFHICKDPLRTFTVIYNS